MNRSTRRYYRQDHQSVRHRRNQVEIRRIRRRIQKLETAVRQDKSLYRNNCCFWILCSLRRQLSSLSWFNLMYKRYGLNF